MTTVQPFGDLSTPTCVVTFSISIKMTNMLESGFSGISKNLGFTGSVANETHGLEILAGYNYGSTPDNCNPKRTVAASIKNVDEI